MFHIHFVYTRESSTIEGSAIAHYQNPLRIASVKQRQMRVMEIPTYWCIQFIWSDMYSGLLYHIMSG